MLARAPRFAKGRPAWTLRGGSGTVGDVLAAPLLIPLVAFQAEAAARAELLTQCADCHPAQTTSYARTGMARALEPLRAGELAGLAPVVEPTTGFTYAFEGDGAGARLVETWSGAGSAGRAPWRDSAPLAFAIGAGELDRSFAVQRAGRWWLAPLEVLGHGAGRHAALAPGHAMAPGTRFTLPVTPECLGCHTDAPPPRDWPLNRAAPAWEPRGISCAACHGELEEHVRVHGGSERAADPLARPWSRVQRMERCAACHLQGDARIELDPARLGPPPPGTPLLDTRAVFVAREPGDEIGFVSHVQRLVLARCYLESATFPDGGLACESCHDPHRSLSEPAERALVRDACNACHEPSATRAPPSTRASACALASTARPAGRDCVDCHMRRTGVFDVAEVAIHDHWIRRTPPAPSPPTTPARLRFPESPSGDWRVFAWPDAAPAGGPTPASADDPGPWTMALFHGSHAERAREYLTRGVGARAKDLPMLHHVRGSLLEQAGEVDAARQAYQRALALDPALAASATNLAPLLARAGEAAAGRRLLDELIQRHPLADTAYRNRAVVRLALGDEAGFRADLENAMRLLPDAGLAQALGRVAERRGDTAGAARWREEALRLDPRGP